MALDSSITPATEGDFVRMHRFVAPAGAFTLPMTSPLWGESTDYQWFPSEKTSKIRRLPMSWCQQVTKWCSYLSQTWMAYHVQVWSPWTPFCRLHFKMNFLGNIYINFGSNLSRVCIYRWQIANTFWQWLDMNMRQVMDLINVNPITLVSSAPSHWLNPF